MQMREFCQATKKHVEKTKVNHNQTLKRVFSNIFGTRLLKNMGPCALYGTGLILAQAYLFAQGEKETEEDRKQMKEIGEIYSEALVVPEDKETEQIQVPKNEETPFSDARE